MDPQSEEGSTTTMKINEADLVERPPTPKETRLLHYNHFSAP